MSRRSESTAARHEEILSPPKVPLLCAVGIYVSLRPDRKGELSGHHGVKGEGGLCCSQPIMYGLVRSCCRGPVTREKGENLRGVLEPAGIR